MSERIKNIFKKNEKKLVTFTTCGDPDLSTSLEILKVIINNDIEVGRVRWINNKFKKVMVHNAIMSIVYSKYNTIGDN
mgnify:CR=1 FL=1